jgi:hypothetical protein
VSSPRVASRAGSSARADASMSWFEVIEKAYLHGSFLLSSLLHRTRVSSAAKRTPRAISSSSLYATVSRHSPFRLQRNIAQGASRAASAVSGSRQTALRNRCVRFFAPDSKNRRSCRGSSFACRTTSEEHDDLHTPGNPATLHRFRVAARKRITPRRAISALPGSLTRT